uniref:Cadherin-1 n=1 Tax=Mastacembelus armatus TaxID=205130 RepID=A0A7N8X3Q9_9TELE
MRRRKRDWVIPDISVAENNRGPFPQKISQIRSDKGKQKKIYYSITGPGADQPPVGLFIMDRDNGILYVTQPLDREKQARYMLTAHAVAEGTGNAEAPMEIVVNVIDQNDNRPIFAQDTFLGEVPEASPIVVATDIDDPTMDNAIIRYRIMSQDPQLPSDPLFLINSVTGVIRVGASGLDREKYPKYTLVVQAGDMVGEGLSTEAKVILTVTDSNDNAPVFTETSYEVTVAENKVGALVVTMSVTDDDEPQSLAWNAKFKIIAGDPRGLFNITTSGNNKQEGIITTVKGLDFEKTSKHTLLVTVENEVPFAIKLPTSTATVVVNVQDVNEPPVFDPKEKFVSKPENLPVDSDVTIYTASDPDTARKQKVMYKIISDPAGWLEVEKDTGEIKVKSAMDREFHFVKDDKYTALIGAYDNDNIPATGTGTLIIKLEDVNDNAPTIEERDIAVRFLCQNAKECLAKMLVLLLLLFVRRRRGEKKEPLLQDDDIRDNIYYYDEEGGGEDDQDYDLSVLHRGLDNRPEVFRNDVVPNFMPAPQYRPRPANPEEIGNFIDDNLKAADNDPTAPPYDSLLVFDYEGGGSDAGSLSSLNSSSSGDHDYDCLNEWGPRFKKLADMYGGGEDDML